MLKCEDCGHPYSEFGLDTTISNYQWSLIHPESSNGILCAKCMVQRASRLLGIIAARMVFEFAPHEAVEHSLHPTSETLPAQEVLSTPEHSATSQGAS